MEWTGAGLEGLSVVDVATGLSGLFCAHRLHHFGAGVLTTRRTDMRLAAGFTPGLEVVEPGDPALAARVETADIVIDDDDPIMRRYAECAGPRAVRVVITPFGRTGPYAGFTATDLTAEAFGGALGSSGLPDRAPVALGGHLVSTYVGGVAAAAAVAELWLVERTGVGAIVEVSAVEALAASMDRRAVQLLTHSYTGWDAERQDGSQAALITGVYACGDGLAYVSLYGWHIKAVCQMIGDPRLDAFIDRPGLALRPPGNAVFRAAVLEWLAARPTREVVDVAQGMGWPVIPVNSLPDALVDPWLVSSGLVAEQEGGLRVPTGGVMCRSAGDRP